jgi:hypothetical protein
MIGKAATRSTRHADEHVTSYNDSSRKKTKKGSLIRFHGHAD